MAYSPVRSVLVYGLIGIAVVIGLLIDAIVPVRVPAWY